MLPVWPVAFNSLVPFCILLIDANGRAMFHWSITFFSLFFLFISFISICPLYLLRPPTDSSLYVNDRYLSHRPFSENVAVAVRLPSQYKEPVPLMGRSAILGEQRNNYFCDVGCGRGEMGDSTYAITKTGLLCEFNNRRLLDKWVELRVREETRGHE